MLAECNSENNSGNAFQHCLNQRWLAYLVTRAPRHTKLLRTATIGTLWSFRVIVFRKECGKVGYFIVKCMRIEAVFATGTLESVGCSCPGVLIIVQQMCVRSPSTGWLRSVVSQATHLKR